MTSYRETEIPYPTEILSKKSSICAPGESWQARELLPSPPFNLLSYFACNVGTQEPCHSSHVCFLGQITLCEIALKSLTSTASSVTWPLQLSFPSYTFVQCHVEFCPQWINFSFFSIFFIFLSHSWLELKLSFPTETAGWCPVALSFTCYSGLALVRVLTSPIICRTFIWVCNYKVASSTSTAFMTEVGS